MARQLRVEYAGALYHVTVRSNSGTNLFRGDRDREYWLYRLGESARLHGVRVHLYCLMSNHFHLLVETPQGNLGRFMHALLTGYTVFFNRQHRVHGHVTQGRYAARLVAGNAYLLSLSRYVHLNPVKVIAVVAKPLAERVQLLREYPWSSYRAYVAATPPPPWLTLAPTLALMGGRGKERQARYGAFAEAGVAKDDEAFKTELIRSARSIGDEAFRSEIEARYAEVVRRARRPEDAALRVATVPAVAAAVVIGCVAREAGIGVEALKRRQRNSGLKAVTAWLLGRYAGLGQRDVAPLLGLVSGSAVSRQIGRVASLLTVDPKASRLLTRAEHAIKGLAVEPAGERR